MPVAELIRRDGAMLFRIGYGEGSEKLAATGDLDDVAPGSIVEIDRDPQGASSARIRRRDGEPVVLAGPETALASIYEIAFRAGLRVGFPDAALAETTALLAAPGIDDPELVDLRSLPFITIDYEVSRDLDQAMFIERAGSGYRICYALADAAHFVRPGSALFEEGVRRAVSYYLPGLTVPMLPPQLSEGIVSLNQGQDRRALVFDMRIDAGGEVVGTELVRARIRSRRKLTYNGVQAFSDGTAPDLGGHDFTETLELLRSVGELRIARAEQRDVVRYDRVNTRLALSSPEARDLTIVAEPRNDVQRWNEQISLLCNIEGARFLVQEVDRTMGLAGVFRVHPPPEPERLDDLARSIDALVERLELEPRWRWRRSGGESLADYVERLPDDGAGGRLAMALQRQAMLANERSFFALEPGPHHGIGAAPYARFSSPMREMVGVVTDHIALHQMAGTSPTDCGLTRERVEAVVEAANRAKQLQKRITKQANKLAMDQLFARDVRLDPGARPRRTATVMGMSPNKVYVQLDDPPVEVKLYVDDLSSRLGHSIALRSRFEIAGGDLSVRVGDEVQVVVDGYDGGRERWLLHPVNGLGGAQRGS